jgi:hypothetical protein
MDLVYLLAVIAFFALSWAFTLQCDQLRPRHSSRED